MAIQFTLIEHPGCTSLCVWVWEGIARGRGVAGGVGEVKDTKSKLDGKEASQEVGRKVSIPAWTKCSCANPIWAPGKKGEADGFPVSKASPPPGI